MVFENAVIDMTSAGDNTKILFGDLDNDGRMELVAIQGNGGFDDRLVPHQVVCVTAFDLDGRQLWQRGEPSATPGTFGADYPAQVYDIDGDGHCEVLCVMNKEFLILDGLSGEVKRSFAIPGKYAHDCIIIANLCGDTYAHDIILKDRYHNMWAFCRDFELLWTHKGSLGHFPWAADINFDGYDEIMAGYDMLNHKGEVLWSVPNMDGHADCVWTGYVDLDVSQGPRIVIGGSSTAMYNAFGGELWRYDGSVETQHIALGRFTEQPELQIAGLDRIIRGDTGQDFSVDGKDGLFLLNAKGEEIKREQRRTSGWLTIADTVGGFDESGLDYILAYRRGGGIMPALYNGELEPAYTFGVDGYAYHADLIGSGATDVLIMHRNRAHIYSSKRKDFSRGLSCPLVQEKRLYNSTLYMGSEHAPREFSYHAAMYRQWRHALLESARPEERKTTVFLAGDSTVCDQERLPFFGWGQVLGGYFENCIAIANYALSGRGVKSFIWEGHLERMIRRIRLGDYLLIQFGHNDQKPQNYCYAEAFSEYNRALELLIDAAAGRGAHPVLVTSVQRRDFDDAGNIRETLGDYPGAMRQLAARRHIPLIDLNAESKTLLESYGVEGSKSLFVHAVAGELPDYPDGIEDNTHFRELGAQAMAGLVCEGIRKAVPALAEHLR